ncbi:MAG TPA: hypothetical protein PKA49_00385 [Tepidiformaceae bacterium]|nr:hypothetical protein [Tepidiformaceae bacterium]
MLVVAAAILALLLRPAGREGLAPVPAGLPATLELGMASAPGGAVAMRQTAPFAYRYQYLAGGPADGWTTWEPDGEFVTSYIRESRTSGMTPVFTYYVLQQSVSGDGSEQARVARGLADAGTMDAYLRGIELFFERAGQAGGTVILHVEPDLWGFGHQIANGDDAARVAVAMPAATGQPSNLAGLARSIVALRDRLAPGVLLAYSLSNWGTGHDFTYGHFTDAEVRVLAESEATFYRSLGVSFDLVFAEFADRDAGYKQFVENDRGASWWDATDFGQHAAYIETFGKRTQLRAMLWQIPYGNTLMAAMDNTRGHYQDNRVEWLLGEQNAAHLRRYADAGVIALLFGRGADGATDARDSQADGVTNTRAPGANGPPSFTADDDGGYFRSRAAAYYQAALPLP